MVPKAGLLRNKLKFKTSLNNMGLFALDSWDLGCTSVVKHTIKLTDYTPFKEKYRCIPPHQYEEVKKHLHEMLEIGAIRQSNSPLASAVVLICKKDGSLLFCIDLHKLNNRNVNDVYSLPHIKETMDCLNGARTLPHLISSLVTSKSKWTRVVNHSPHLQLVH